MARIKHINNQLHPLELKWAFGTAVAAKIMKIRGYTLEEALEILLEIKK